MPGKPSVRDFGTGWIDQPGEVARVESMMDLPGFCTAGHRIRDTGRGKKILLYECVRNVTGGDIVTNQGRVGSCVAFGAKKAIDTVACVEIDLKDEHEQWVAGACPEAIYGLSRVEIGGGRLRGTDGSIGAWASRACEEYGTLMQLKYDSVDCRKYNQKRCRKWGDDGLPDPLEPLAAEHKVLNCSAVRTYDEARDAIANGYPVTVASNQGFTTKRDDEGFAKPRGKWAHQMCFTGVDDAHGRPGLLCENSWGPAWIDGPKRHEQPDGSFWVDAEIVERMLRQGDSWAYSNFKGFPPQKLDWRLSRRRKKRSQRQVKK